MNDLLGIAIVFVTVTAVMYLDKTKNKYTQKVLQWTPAILFAYIIPALFTYCFDLELSDIALHTLSKNFIIPLAIVLVMGALSIKQLKVVGLKPILLFISGSAAIAILPIVLLLGVNSFTEVLQIEILDREYWKGLVTLVGSWIGGSTSQLVLKEIVECSESVFLIVLVLDNILVNIWTILMFQFIKRSSFLNNLFHIKEKPISSFSNKKNPSSIGWKASIKIMTICLGVVLASLLIGNFLLKIIVLSILGFVFGNTFSFWNHKLVIKIGGYLIICIMAILGLKLNFSGFAISGYIVVFAIVWLILHYVVMLIVAYVLKVNLAWVPICSMANVGGISTAPAVTKAFNESWMPHAILLAVLSMVTGTYWGLLTIYLFETVF